MSLNCQKTIEGLVCVQYLLSAAQKQDISVLYPEKGVCADPVDKGAILGEGGGVIPSSDRGRQLATDIAGEKT
jgi:hypothetical protein